MPALGRRRAFLSLLLALPLFAQDDLLRQAVTLHQSGNIPAAIPVYEKYLAAHPDSAMALSNLGAAYAHVGRYDDAIVQCRRALKLQPANPPVQMNLGLAFYKTGQIDDAAATFDKVHRAAPAELQPILLLGDCWLNMGANKKVIDLLTPVAAQRPDDLAIAYMLGTALIRDDQPTRGQPFVDRILRNGDSAEARLLLGTTKLQAGDNPAALADLAKAVELNPRLPHAQSYYGQALLRTGDPAHAAEAFRKALAGNPYDFTANLQLAIILREQEQMDEAREFLRRALRVRPDDILVRFQLAAIELHDGKLETARRDLESIAKQAPTYTEAHITLATVYYRLQRKADGDREREIVRKLTAEKQAKQAQGLNVK